MFQRLAILFVCVVVLTYAVFIPAYSWYLECSRPKPMMVTLEDSIDPAQDAYIRIAKVLIFGLFAYCGASVGSFLNVVADCIPSGKSFISRSSACPQCGTPIRRSDNLPIFGYLRLKGRCRACGTPIPLRYLIVEIIGAAIFGSLFFFELINGAANVPGFREYAYNGVVWIVLYTKWDVIALYFFHAIFLSLLMCIALIELNRERTPAWFGIASILSFAIFAMSSDDLAPDQFLVTSRDSFTQRALWCVIAIAVGLMLSWLLQLCLGRQSFNHDSTDVMECSNGLRCELSVDCTEVDSHSLMNISLAMMLIALVVGWYPAVLIFIISVILIPLADRWMKRCHQGDLSLSVWILFLLAWVHQPFWEWFLVLSA